MNAKQFLIVICAVLIIAFLTMWTFAGLPIEGSIFEKPLAAQMH